jgi:hypothetical protein
MIINKMAHQSILRKIAFFKVSTPPAHRLSTGVNASVDAAISTVCAEDRN